MSIKRILLAAAATSVLIVGFVPVAQAAKIDAGICIERHDRLGPQGRLRDAVERPEFDRLQRWIARHPRLAARAAAELEPLERDDAGFQETARSAKENCLISKALGAIPEINLDARLES